MKTIGILMTAAAVLFVCAMAYADDFTPAGTTTLGAPASQMTALVAMTCMVGAAALGYLMRRLSPGGGFLHSNLGHLVITGAAGALSTAAQVIQTKGFNWMALAFGLLGAVSGFLGASNSSTPLGEPAPLARKLPSLEGASVVPRGSKAMLILLALFAFWPGCTPGALALGKCELNALPQTLESVLVGIASIAAQPTGALGDLEQLGQGLAPGQFSCAVQAVQAALAKQVPKGEASPLLQLQLKNLGEYLTKHKPVACRSGWAS